MVSQIRAYVEGNAGAAADQDGYANDYAALSGRYESIQAGLAAIDAERLECAARLKRISEFLDTLEQRDLLAEFDEELWRATVESVTVYSDHEIAFRFKNGAELNWEL